MIILSKEFYITNRKRQTKYWRDWSTDVGSSDLVPEPARGELLTLARTLHPDARRALLVDWGAWADRDAAVAVLREFGRASCRDRAYISVDAVLLKYIFISSAFTFCHCRTIYLSS